MSGPSFYRNGNMVQTHSSKATEQERTHFLSTLACDNAEAHVWIHEVRPMDEGNSDHMEIEIHVLSNHTASITESPALAWALGLKR